MSNTSPQPRPSIPMWAWIIIIILITSVLGLLLLASMRPVPRKMETKNGPTDTVENHLISAKEALNGQRDLGSCRQAINHLNKERMSRANEIQKLSIPGAIPEEVLLKYKDYLNSTSSPGIDAWYIEECLFFREIAISGDFQVKTMDSTSSIKAVTELWDWVMREVALHDAPLESSIKAPLHWILRRGTGTSEERALIFLTMLRHIGIPDVTGCLIRFHSSESPFQFLVGIRTPDGKPHLFDPVIGLPLEKMPSVDFKQIISGNWPIGEWTGKANNRNQLKLSWNDSSFGIAVPLPALAPRNKDFSLLIPEDTHAIPAIDPSKEIADWSATLDREGISNPKVSFDLPTLVRWPGFLPGAEGGDGNPSYVQLFSYSYVPWELLPREILQAHPLLARLQVQNALGLSLPQPVGERLMFGVFAPIFRNWHETADKGRDLLIRFQFSRIVPDLKQEKDEIQGRVGKFFNEPEKAFIRSWLDDANTAYAGLARNAGNHAAEEQVKSLWERSGPILMTVLIPAANARMEEIQVALALAKHEQASQMDRRQAKKIPGNTLSETTRAWRSAVEGWAQLTNEGKAQSGALAHIARFQGEALWKSGNPAKAKELWDLHAGTDSPDARACAVLAKTK